MIEKDEYNPYIDSLTNQQLSFQSNLLNIYFEIEKEKYQWVYQIITIIGAIIGGLSLLKENRHLLDNIFLFVLFSCVFILFSFLHKEISYRDKKLREVYDNIQDIFSTSIQFRLLNSKSSLNKDERKQLKKLRNKLCEIKIKTDEGYEKIKKSEEEVADYSLSQIVVFIMFICIVGLIFSDYLHTVIP